MHRKNRVTVGVTVLTILLSRTAAAQNGVFSIYPLDAERVAWVESTLSKMNVEEKVGQLIIPGLSGRFINRTVNAFEQVQANIRDFHVGGYHIFGGDLAGSAVLLNRMQRVSVVPLLITADLEGGAGYQFPGATRLPRAMAMGAAGNPEFVYEAAKITATEGRQLGIHVNFYPVVDVNNNPRNPIINIRSFGEDVEAVAQLSRAYIRGSQENGMVATAKHFPGHGDTAQDSHMELPSILAPRERLDKVELPPFVAAIREGVMAVMTAHLFVPALESEPGLPATLSERILGGLLRNDLGFKGLVFTDAMTMRGITGKFANQDAALRAFEAGADFILYPPDVKDAYQALLNGVRAGKISPERLDASVRRVLTVKARLDLQRQRTTDLTRLDEIVGRREHQESAQRMIDSAITLVRDERRLLPLKLPAASRVLHLNLVDGPGWRDAPGRVFFEELKKRYKNATQVEIFGKSARTQYRLAEAGYKKCDAVIVTAFIRVSANKGSIELSRDQLALLKRLDKGKKPFAFAMFGSPFLLNAVPELSSYVLAYEYYAEAETATLRALTGEIPFRGKLPVALPGLYPIGFSLTRQ